MSTSYPIPEGNLVSYSEFYQDLRDFFEDFENPAPYVEGFRNPPNYGFDDVVDKLHSNYYWVQDFGKGTAGNKINTQTSPLGFRSLGGDDPKYYLSNRSLTEYYVVSKFSFFANQGMLRYRRELNRPADFDFNVYLYVKSTLILGERGFNIKNSYFIELVVSEGRRVVASETSHGFQESFHPELVSLFVNEIVRSLGRPL